jgi:membrane protein YqaA with SNARE-associated domain
MHDLIVIYLAGLTGIWKAIPVGMMLNTSPLSVGLMTLSGSCTTTTALYLFGGWVKRIVEKRSGRKRMQKKRMRAKRLMAKYGIIGLGLIGTIAIGPSATIITGLLLTGSGKRMLMWTIAGILLWTTVLTSFAAAGLELFGRIGGSIL